jgi:2-polyprenyl-3-methyl-5-hydroxy-6-metoxy-1,4-benzoquinol methylase
MEGQAGERFAIVLIVEPTSPFRLPSDVEAILRRLVSTGADSVVAVSALSTKSHPHKVHTLSNGRLGVYETVGRGIVARQQLQQLYYRNGVCSALTRRCLMEQGTVFGAHCEPEITTHPVINIEEKLRLIGAEHLRDRVVADIGCGAGSFLDLARGVASATLGIEPTRAYHDTLRARGHEAFSYVDHVADGWAGRVDLAVCFSVVEHVRDPVSLLAGIRRLLTPKGRLVLSTPNARDWLLEVLPRDYGAFFHRLVHQWYFDAASIEQLALRAGFSRCAVTHVHRFDLSTLLLWLRDRRPTGMGKLEVSAALDAAFCRGLEAAGRADHLYATLQV